MLFNYVYYRVLSWVYCIETTFWQESQNSSLVSFCTFQKQESGTTGNRQGKNKKNMVFNTRGRLYLMAALVLFPILLSSCMAKKSSESSVETKIEGFSLEQKIDFIGGLEEFNIRGMEELGIPEVHISDGPVGLRNYGKSTAYPSSICLASSWDKKLANHVGKALGMEAKSKNVHVLLGPGMNIYRMPVCGRNFEYLGEDPYLAGQLAKEYIIGMQNQGVMATAKHYVANNQEFNRHHCSSDMDERTLHEIYLPAFKTAVKEGRVASVMTAYNPINGTHASEHNFLNNKILKGDWGFEGFVISDWVSTYDGIACAKGGLDLEMPSGKMMSRETLIPAIKDGKIEESIIDGKVRRILNAYERFNLFEKSNISEGFYLDSAFVRQVALENARSGMVLLKNESDILPLKRNNDLRIAVIGPNGHPVVTGGGGSSHVDPLHPVSLLDAVKSVSDTHADVVYEKGIFTGVPFPEDIFEEFDFLIPNAAGDTEIGVKAEFFDNKELEGTPVLEKSFGKLNLENEDFWGFSEIPEVNFSARFTCHFIPEESGYYLLGVSGDDGYRLLVDGVEVIDMWRDQGDTPAKHEVFLNGGQKYQVILEYYQSGGEAKLRLGAQKINLDIKPEQYFPRALSAARGADYVIMAVGFDPTTESEAFDRTFELPHNQADLINRVAGVNENIIVIINSGGNVEMNSWIDNAKAVLMAWYPGQEGNLAAAEILFGKVNPSGRLPVSFEYNIQDNPSYEYYFDHDNDSSVFYGEGIFMGYRHWDKSPEKPRFPFGYGLSYTRFHYRDLSTNKQIYEINDTVEVTLKVENIGDCKGAEVVQLYVSDTECSLPRPIKELKAFEKVHLIKGEERLIKMNLKRDAFAFFNPESDEWEVEPGEFEILVGHSSEDIRLRQSIVLK
jgi:beta-glucosidase